MYQSHRHGWWHKSIQFSMARLSLLLSVMGGHALMELGRLYLLSIVTPTILTTTKESTMYLFITS